jgi:hypothetical protein
MYGEYDEDIFMDDQDQDKDIELDNSWIKDFESLEQDYKQYYKEDINSIRLHCIYVNRENDIDKIKEEKIILSRPNQISREEMIGLIKKNNIYRNIKYTILSILKFNINLEPENLKTFIKNSCRSENNDNNQVIENEFLTSIKNIDAISFNKTISMFQDLNDLFIVFYEKDSTNINNKKESVGSEKVDYMSPDKNKTKKIILRPYSGRKHTIRKQLKEVTLL